MFLKYDFRKFIKTPNNLTMFRVITIPGVVLLMLYPNRFCSFLAAILFSAAAISDYFDGFLARQRGMETTFGKIMDPLADKLLVSSTFIMLASLNRVPAWLVCIIVGRELAVTALRNMMTEVGGDVGASNLGKYKTGFQIAACIPLLIYYPFLGIKPIPIGIFFMWGALLFTIWSGVDYFVKYLRLLNN